jgi:HlyD family secretion protein
MKKVILLIVVIIAIAGGYYAYLQYQERQAAEAIRNLQTTTVAQGELTSTIGATGEVHSNQTTSLLWKTSGSVEDVDVEVGDNVITSQVLASLEQTSLPQTVILAQADQASAQKSLEDLETNAEIAKTESLQAISVYTKQARDAQYQLDNFTVPSNQANLETVEALELLEEKLNQAREAFEPYKYKSSSDAIRKELKDNLEEAQSDYNTAVRRLDYEYDLAVAKANLEKAKQDYETWKDGPDPADVTAVEARIAAAEATLKQAWIEAPFNGTITVVNPKPGDQVAPNVEAFRLDDLSRLLMDVQVSEVDINQVKVGQETSLTFDAILDEIYKGIVVEVAPIGTSTQGVVDFIVTIKITDPDENVKPGMTAAVNIVVNQLDNVLLIPNRAVRIKDGKRVVYVMRDNEPTPVQIILGASSDTMSEVIDGELEVGDLIVLNPPTEFDSNGPPPFVHR